MKFFSTPPRWEEYKDFYQLTIFRYLAMWFSIVPLIAGLLSGLPDPLPINLAGTVYHINLELPFNWKLLWLSSLIFLISFGLYLYKCPPFIKKYNQFSDYLAYCHDKRWMAWLIKDLFDSKVDLKKFRDRMLEKGYAEKAPASFQKTNQNPIVLEKQTLVYIEVDGEIYTSAFPIKGSADDANEAERGVFWEIFGRYSSSNYACRIIIRVLLLISALLFTTVLLQNIYVGLTYLVPSLKNAFTVLEGCIGSLL
ncbi:hypothetical protein [Pseudomonas sp. AP-1]|uniref:hypothetical protein n=1 Tax=Pseudomonas sp. AP-1 TaxID=3231718 RepID=UPI0035B400EE